MKTLKSVLQPFNSTRLIPLLLAITLTACGSDFQEGAYVDPQYGTGYEFNAEGQGQLIGGVPGSPLNALMIKPWNDLMAPG